MQGKTDLYKTPIWYRYFVNCNKLSKLKEWRGRVDHVFQICFSTCLILTFIRVFAKNSLTTPSKVAISTFGSHSRIQSSSSVPPCNTSPTCPTRACWHERTECVSNTRGTAWYAVREAPASMTISPWRRRSESGAVARSCPPTHSSPGKPDIITNKNLFRKALTSQLPIATITNNSHLGWWIREAWLNPTPAHPGERRGCPQGGNSLL